MSADAEALLRRFEPVVRSTKGDKFYPMDVEPYVRACSLWVQRPGEEAVCVVPQGKLDLDTLAQQPLDEAGAVHFLMFTDPRDLARPGSRGGRFRVFGRRAARGFKESREAFRAGYNPKKIPTAAENPTARKTADAGVAMLQPVSRPTSDAPPTPTARPSRPPSRHMTMLSTRN